MPLSLDPSSAVTLKGGVVNVFFPNALTAVGQPWPCDTLQPIAAERDVGP